MIRYHGTCSGGPLDGQSLVTTRREYTVPIYDGSGEVKFGSYLYDSGTWKWHA